MLFFCPVLGRNKYKQIRVWILFYNTSSHPITDYFLLTCSKSGLSYVLCGIVSDRDGDGDDGVSNS